MRSYACDILLMISSRKHLCWTNHDSAFINPQTAVSSRSLFCKTWRSNWHSSQWSHISRHHCNYTFKTFFIYLDKCEKCLLVQTTQASCLSPKICSVCTSTWDTNCIFAYMNLTTVVLHSRLSKHLNKRQKIYRVVYLQPITYCCEIFFLEQLKTIHNHAL